VKCQYSRTQMFFCCRLDYSMWN